MEIKIILTHISHRKQKLIKRLYKWPIKCETIRFIEDDKGYITYSRAWEWQIIF